MNIVIFEAEHWEQAAFQPLGEAHAVRFVAEPLTTANAANFTDAEVISTFMNSTLNPATLEPLARLRLVATRSTGYDHIDLAFCRAHGVTVCNVPNYGDPTVAEHAFALLLALSRRVTVAVDRVRHGDYAQGGLRGFDLAGKTLGVVGTGRIGQRAIQIGKGFGMKVLAFDARPNPALATTLGFSFVDLAALLAQCDVLTLHVPGGPGTKDLISTVELAMMKPSAVVVNTARGGVVNVEALVCALSEHRLAGAALDVLGEEAWQRDEAEIFRTNTVIDPSRLRTLVANHALLSLDNVIVTPHIAYDTTEALQRIIATSVGNIEGFAHGTPCNVVAA